MRTLKTQLVLDKISKYKTNYTQHFHRMQSVRFPEPLKNWKYYGTGGNSEGMGQERLVHVIKWIR
jgi:hypothetical protein